MGVVYRIEEKVEAISKSTDIRRAASANLGCPRSVEVRSLAAQPKRADDL